MTGSAIERLNAALSGRYSIERELGEGGMATVYLARDEKHNRNVALKVLKPELAAVVGAERFLAEIETTANLQHPHILPLFDSGEADSFLFYVMPYIEGETLRDRIDRDKQLPVDEAIGIAAGVANALATAHEAGVVHRDIKPGNILMSRGEPLVADFGIALAVGTAGGSRLTETGLSVGTPYYMSPEQATGDQAIGPASDIYALAAVLYEMLVGEPPYVGNTAQAVLGKILQGVPVSATAVRKTIPLNVDAALRKALEKLPADRFTNARDFARALGDPSFRHGVSEQEAAAARGGPWKAATVAASVVAALSLGSLAWSAASAPEAAPGRIERYESPFRPDQSPLFFAAGDYDISPDGSMLAYYGPPSEAAAPQIWIRRWNDLESTPLRGTVAGVDIAVSPDGSEIAFWQQGDLKVVPTGGGPARTLASMATRFPRWSEDGYVYFGSSTGLFRVPAAGGVVDTLARTEEGEIGMAPGPIFPDHGVALLVAGRSDGAEFRVLDLESGEMRTLAQGAMLEWFEPGYLAWTFEGQLLVAGFDLSTMALTGPGTAVLDEVASFRVSEDGRLFYATGASGQAQQEMIWVNRAGAAIPVEAGWRINAGGNNAGWRLSSDGRRIAVREATESGLDIWVKEVDGGPRSRLTLDPAEDRKPVWGPDAGTVTFLSNRADNLDVYSRRADGTGQVELVLDLERTIAEAEWSADGTWLLIRTGGPEGQIGGRDILAMRPGVDTEPMPLLDGAYDESAPALSPDGRWLAYTSNETGRHEVFVRPFPGVDEGRWQVSTDGGFSPRWSRDGRELFFVNSATEMVAASVDASEPFRVAGRSVLFSLGATWVTSDIAVPYDVGSGERQFLMARAYLAAGDGVAAPPDMVLVVNWVEEVKERVPR